MKRRIGKPGKALEHAPRSVTGALNIAPEKSRFGSSAAFNSIGSSITMPRKSSTSPRRSGWRNRVEDRAHRDARLHHALPAAPAGGPAKDSANGPIATMSTSTSCGPAFASASIERGLELVDAGHALMRQAERRAQQAEIRRVQVGVVAPAAELRVLDVADHPIAAIVHQDEHDVGAWHRPRWQARRG